MTREMFEKGYRLGYKEGRKSAPIPPPINRISSDGAGTAPMIQARPLGIPELLHDRMNTATNLSQRPLNIHSDLQTPLMVAIAGGALVAGMVVIVASGGAYYFIEDAPLKTYGAIVWIGIVAGGVVTLMNWFGTSKMRTFATISLENMINMDINGDGVVGNPLPNVGIPLGKQSYLISHKRSADVDLDITKEQAIRIYDHLKKTDWKFSRRNLKYILSQDAYPGVFHWMKYYGLIGEKSTGQLNDDGKGFWASVAQKSTSTPPPPH